MGVKQSLSNFAKQAKSKINGKKRNIKKEEEKKFKKNCRSWEFEKITTICRGGISDFDDEAFYGLRSDFEQRKQKFKKN